jgi:hypothetical protein
MVITAQNTSVPLWVVGAWWVRGWVRLLGAVGPSELPNIIIYDLFKMDLFMA